VKKQNYGLKFGGGGKKKEKRLQKGREKKYHWKISAFLTKKKTR